MIGEDTEEVGRRFNTYNTKDKKTLNKNSKHKGGGQWCSLEERQKSYKTDGSVDTKSKTSVSSG